jgi:hypothetical protein
MSDTNERSVASTGSHPVSGGPITLRLSNEEQQEMLSRLAGWQSGTLVPLDLPQPALTDDERGAIEAAAAFFSRRYPPAANTLRTLLERTR